MLDDLFDASVPQQDLNAIFFIINCSSPIEHTETDAHRFGTKGLTKLCSFDENIQESPNRAGYPRRQTGVLNTDNFICREIPAAPCHTLAG